MLYTRQILYTYIPTLSFGNTRTLFMRCNINFYGKKHKDNNMIDNYWSIKRRKFVENIVHIKN